MDLDVWLLHVSFCCFFFGCHFNYLWYLGFSHEFLFSFQTSGEKKKATWVLTGMTLDLWYNSHFNNMRMSTYICICFSLFQRHFSDSSEYVLHIWSHLFLCFSPGHYFKLILLILVLICSLLLLYRNTDIFLLTHTLPLWEM